MDLNITFRAPPSPCDQAAMFGAGMFSKSIGGAFGYVRKHMIKQASVTVELLNGITLHSVRVPSRDWVVDEDGDVSGTVDLPPLDSLVFVLFPYGIENVAGAMVMFSVFDYKNQNHQSRLAEGEEKKVVTLRSGGIKTTYDRETGNYLVEDIDDANFKILLDKENKRVELVEWNGNEVVLSDAGMAVEDANGNKVTGTSSGLKLEAKNNTVFLQEGKVTVDGTAVELNGNSKSLVTHAELNTALQAIVGTLNTQLGIIAAGATAAITASGLWLTPLTIGGLTLDISAAQTATVKTGG